RYRAPKGALTSHEIERLRQSRATLIRLLERRSPELPAAPLTRAPLAFSQLAHWHFRGLATGGCRREVACVTRLIGELDAEALQAGLLAMVHRHDALRTRIVLCEGAPVQEIAEHTD